MIFPESEAVHFLFHCKSCRKGQVALDVACADAVNKMPVVDSSVLGENIKADSSHGDGHDHFHMTHPDTEWKSCIEHAVKIGLGSDQYELVEI